MPGDATKGAASGSGNGAAVEISLSAISQQAAASGPISPPPSGPTMSASPSETTNTAVRNDASTRTSHTRTSTRRAKFVLPPANVKNSSGSCSGGSSSETDSRGDAAGEGGGGGASSSSGSTGISASAASGLSASAASGACAVVTATGTSSSGGGVSSSGGDRSSTGASGSGCGRGSGSGSSGEDRSTSARSSRSSSGGEQDKQQKVVEISGIGSIVGGEQARDDNMQQKPKMQSSGAALGLHHHRHGHGHRNKITSKTDQHQHQHQQRHVQQNSTVAPSASNSPELLGTSVQPDRMTASGHAAVVASAKLPSPPVPAVASSSSSSPSRRDRKNKEEHHRHHPTSVQIGSVNGVDGWSSSLPSSSQSERGGGPNSSGSGSDEGTASAAEHGQQKQSEKQTYSFSLPKKLPPPEHGASGRLSGEDSSMRPMSVSAEGLPLPPTDFKKPSAGGSGSGVGHHFHTHHRHAKKPSSASPKNSTSSASSLMDNIEVSKSRSIMANKPSSSSAAAAVVASKSSKAKKQLHHSASLAETFDDSSSSSSVDDKNSSSGNSGSEGGYEGSSSSNAETREGSCSSPSVSSSEASGDSKHGPSTSSRKLLAGSMPSVDGPATVAMAAAAAAASSHGPRVMRRTGSSSSSSSDLADMSAAALPSVSGVTGKDFTFRSRDSSRDSKSSSLSLSSSSVDPAAEAPAASRKRQPPTGGVASAGSSSIPTGSSDEVSAALKMDESFKRKIERACSAQNDRRRRQLQLLSLDRHGMKSDLRRKRSRKEMKGEPEDSSSLSDEPGDTKRRKTTNVSMSTSPVMGPCAMDWEAAVAPVPDLSSVWQKSPIYGIGADAMAGILAFLEPPEVHTILTMPLSKTWRTVYTAPQDLWKVLCLEAPFFAKIEDAPADSDSENSSLCSFPICSDTDSRHILGRYRLLYTSFVRCMRYLARIKDDAVNGRAPSALDDVAGLAPNLPFNGNASLKKFFHKARGIIDSKRRASVDTSSSESSIFSSSDDGIPNQVGQGRHDAAPAAAAASPIGVVDDGSSVESAARANAPARKKQKKSKVRYGNSKLTKKLLGPSIENGVGGPVELPWSCAIYSVVNWMVAFADVEGIQVMCLKVLPCLLEDEKQRTTAQRAGLTDIVLRAMVLFPDSVEVHTAAFHTLVLLARPLGGHEGDLFHSAMLNASGIFNVGTNTGRNGIAIMLDSMRRFSHEEVLQAMSCWSMVNIALIPKQKTMLVKLGGISVVANAMMQHPFNAEVQFRALFALINLVIPSENLAEDDPAEAAVGQELGVSDDVTERDMLNENVGQISNLVVVAMKNFCSSEAILNRACLVLHNLSLNEDYHRGLLWTPNCYQMLEWCIGNYRHDQVLQQSAGGTLQRLQMTLANDNDLRMRFLETIRAQQQSQLEQVRREAMSLQEVQDQASASNGPE